MTDADEPPFGAFAPSPMQMRARRLAHALPDNYWGRRAASLLIGPAGARARRAFDVDIFGSQRARLHPYDNICEKRVYATPQLWDAKERAALARAISQSADGVFRFVDIGANVGLYALYARARCLDAVKTLRAICVEPDPEMRARLAFNAAASGAEEDLAVLPYAAAGEDGPVRFAVNVESRGMSRIDPAGGLRVEGRSILSILREEGLARVDAMKIDIEGHEYAVLESFFADAPDALLPELLILEISHERENRRAGALALESGYRELFRTRLNLVAIRAQASG
ncbi:FkbM family methyltransferase [Amphiplicatus metriothermophilus]|uniref:Methyltransferase, FkbM family n=1 Tax=Amphiplicatus metriothermophilus TaxID=1519374 RepID=A0A239PJY8_9PROT|nr:FkbM family methyltransferase [Amphiplicatus metriothermophilus]MBB5517771.1 FkbM family methyltransferase [Amphiplicatus metriothermophilus]SNT67895.1 methyltransferase, FkbM family [Amphiplicatus metriothermophilus]